VIISELKSKGVFSQHEDSRVRPRQQQRAARGLARDRVDPGSGFPGNGRYAVSPLAKGVEKFVAVGRIMEKHKA